MKRINKHLITGKVASIILCLFLALASAQAQTGKIKVMELRDYLMRPGQRDHFIDSFETKIIDTLDARGNYVLGQYRMKDAPDDFVWFRGFDDMSARLKALEGFYTSSYWAQHVSIPQKYVLGYTNVYLLKPLHIANKRIDSTSAFETAWFGKPKGLATVDFFVANERRSGLLQFIATTYDSVLKNIGVNDVSYWISETTPNNYPQLPAFQDKNLVVVITFFTSEKEYNASLKKLHATLTEEQLSNMKRLVTIKTTWLLYPTEKSFSIEKQTNAQ